MKTQYSKVNSFSIQHGDNGSVAVVKTAQRERERAKAHNLNLPAWLSGMWVVLLLQPSANCLFANATVLLEGVAVLLVAL